MLFISMSRDQHSNVVSGGAGLILSALITTQSNIQKITIMRNGAGVILSALIVPPRCNLSTVVFIDTLIRIHIKLSLRTGRMICK